MPASLSLPPRHSRDHFEALASEPTGFINGLTIGLLLTIAGAGIVGFCVTLAGL